MSAFTLARSCLITWKTGAERFQGILFWKQVVVLDINSQVVELHIQPGKTNCLLFEESQIICVSF